jgi:type IV pilus assembly protein PilE
LSYTARSARAAAAAALTENAQFMERKFTETNCYQCSSEAIGSISLTRTQAPDTGNASYLLTLDDANTDPTTFRLVATRTGNMTGDECGNLTLDHLGQKSVINQPGGATMTAAQCWGN